MKRILTSLLCITTLTSNVLAEDEGSAFGEVGKFLLGYAAGKVLDAAIDPEPDKGALLLRIEELEAQNRSNSRGSITIDNLDDIINNLTSSQKKELARKAYEEESDYCK